MTHDHPNLTESKGLRAYVEQHPQSPLSARLAYACIEAGEYEQALRLCNSGLERYPDFPSLLLLLAKAQTALRQYQPARARLRELLEEHPASLAALQLLERIGKIEAQQAEEARSTPAQITAPDFTVTGSKEKKANWSWRHHLIPGEEIIVNKRSRDFDLEAPQKEEPGKEPPSQKEEPGKEPPSQKEEQPRKEEQPEHAPYLHEPAQPANVRTYEIPEFTLRRQARETHSASSVQTAPDNAGAGREDDIANPDADIETLADRLEGATIPKLTHPSPQEELFSDEEGQINIESRPVTETLAQIYARQGKFEQAIEVYRKLREKHYDRRYEFTERISELKRLLENQRIP